MLHGAGHVIGTKLAGVLGVSVLALFLRGVAGAESAKAPNLQEVNTNVTKQREVLEGEVGESDPAGYRPGEEGADSDAAASRTPDLEQRAWDPREDSEAQRGPAVASRAGLEQRVQGEDQGVTLVFGGLLSGGAKTDTALNNPAVQTLTRGRESVRSHRDSHRAL